MIHLVVKDILIQRKTLLAAFLYVLLFMYAFQAMGEGQLIATISAVAFMFIMTGGAWEEKVNSDVLTNSLPIPKWQIVGAKYLAALIYVAIVAGIYGLFHVIFSSLGLSIIATSFRLSGIILGLVAVLIGSSFYLPIYFALGYARSRYAYFILFFGAMALISLLTNVLPQGEGWLTSIIEGLLQIGNGLAVLAITGTTVLILVAFSISLSLALYKRREF